MPFRISIACCNCLFAEGIQQLIAGGKCDMDYRISIIEPGEKITAKTNLLITDFHILSRMNIETLVRQKVDILLLSTDCLPSINNKRLLGLISKGLIGVLLPKTDASWLKKAIKCIASGELWFTRQQLKGIATCVKNGRIEFDIPLTRKEINVVKAICKGCCNKEIMKHLNMSEQSVKKHLSTLFKKVKVTDRLQLALYAMKHWPFYFSET